MKPGPKPVSDSLRLEQELESVKKENFRLRRQLLRFKQLAQEAGGNPRSGEAGMLHRCRKALGDLEGMVRHHFRGLVLLGLIGLVALPFSPLIVLLMLFPAGRSIIWSILQKAPSALDILMLVKHKLLGNAPLIAPKDEAVRPLLYARPHDNEQADAAREKRWSLLQQVSPHKRYLLHRYRLTRQPLVSDIEDPVLQSMSSSETSMIKIAVPRKYPAQDRD